MPPFRKMEFATLPDKALYHDRHKGQTNQIMLVMSFLYIYRKDKAIGIMFSWIELAWKHSENVVRDFQCTQKSGWPSKNMNHGHHTAYTNKKMICMSVLYIYREDTTIWVKISWVKEAQEFFEIDSPKICENWSTAAAPLEGGPRPPLGLEPRFRACFVYSIHIQRG